MKEGERRKERGKRERRKKTEQKGWIKKMKGRVRKTGEKTKNIESETMCLRKKCERCGRDSGYMRKFKICRICFRELAHQGVLPGVRKASW